MCSTIDKVRNRKENNALFIDGINFGRVIAIQTYDISFKSIIKEFVRLMAFNYRIKIEGKQTSKQCLFYSLRSDKRKDYDEIVDLFNKTIHDIKSIELLRYISLINLHKKIYIFIKNLIRFSVNGVSDPCIVALVVSHYMFMKSYLDRFDLFKDISVLCTFCDAYGPDNLVAQMAINKGITTVTLQHGQYRVLSAGNEIADAEAYENFVSNYMLVWGQATIDEFKRVGIDSDRLIKVGALKNFSFNKKVSTHKIKGVFGVVLSGEPYKKTNINMIGLANSIAEKYNLKYFLRMHPNNDKNFYLQYCKSECLYQSAFYIENIKYAEKVDFSLIHMTGVFVELLSINSPIIIYKDVFLEKIFQIEPYCIENMVQFEILYELFLIDRKKFLENQFDKYKYYNEFENVMDNYKTAMNSLQDKKIQ